MTAGAVLLVVFRGITRDPSPGPAGPLRTAGLALAGLVFGVATAMAGGLSPPRLSTTAAGDSELIDEVERAIGASPTGFDSLVVVTIDGDERRWAGFGRQSDGEPVDDDTAFEIGSVTKVLTGELLARLETAGTVDTRSSLGELVVDAQEATAWPDAVRSTTVEDLSTHHSGFPRLAPLRPRSAFRGATAVLTGGNPYSEDAADLFRALDDVEPGPGEFGYSNLGYATLGHGLARSQDSDYIDLLTRVVLDPLGMSSTVVVGDKSELPGARVDGHGMLYRPAEPWIAEGWQPAGVGVWSTAHDLRRFVTEVLAAPGQAADALKPRTSTDGDDDIGYAWFSRTLDDGRRLTWHNGATGGFRSYVGLLRDEGRAVVVLSNSSRRSAEPLAHALLLGEEPPRPSLVARVLWTLGAAVGGLLLPIWFLFRTRSAVFGERPPDPDADGAPTDRLGIVSAWTEWLVVAGILVVGLTSWATAAPGVMLVIAGGVGAAMAVTAAMMGGLPWMTSGRPAFRWLGVVVRAVIFVGLWWAVLT